MKIGVAREELLKAILIAERIVGKRESLPVLSCILLDATSVLSIQSTNLESGITTTIPAKIEETGRVTVPAGILSQTIRSLRGDTVNLKTEDGNLSIESRGTTTLIKAIPHEEFPELPTQEVKGTTLAREKFLAGLKAVSYAASPSMIRPELGSIYINIAKNKLTFAATDSFRLAEKVVIGAGGDDVGELLLPFKHAGELVTVLERLEDETITIATEESQCVIASGKTRFMSRITNAQFPAYQEIIPKDSKAAVTVLKTDLSEMLKKAHIFAGSDQNIGFHIYPQKKLFSATARSGEIGEMSDHIDAAVTGEDLDINFHITYLVDCLSSIESDSITLSFAGIGRPLVMKGVSDASFRYLVMPLNR